MELGRKKNGASIELLCNAMPFFFCESLTKRSVPTAALSYSVLLVVYMVVDAISICIYDGKCSSLLDGWVV